MLRAAVLALALVVPATAADSKTFRPKRVYVDCKMIPADQVDHSMHAQGAWRLKPLGITVQIPDFADVPGPDSNFWVCMHPGMPPTFFAPPRMT